MRGKTALDKFVAEIKQEFVTCLIENNFTDYINPENLRWTEPSYPATKANLMVMSLIHLYYSYEDERMTVSYPADWVEAVKDRWFPKWLKRRFPVRMTLHTITREVMLTNFPVQSGQKIILRPRISEFLEQYAGDMYEG